MLGKRVLTALLLLPILLSVVILGEVAGTAILVAVVSAVGMVEYLRFSQANRTSFEELILAFYAGVIVLSFLHPSPILPGVVLAVGALAYALYEALKWEPSTETLHRTAHVTTGWLWVPFFTGHAVTLRRFGYEPLIFLIILVMAGDTFAYLTGTLLGRHKLAPKVSPKKSIEGSVGGMLGTAAMALVFAPILVPGFGVTAIILIAVVINVAAQAGDLVESMFKRAAGVKDSGTIFPGHGGMLDRLDSFLPTLPLFASILSIFGGA